MLCIILTLTVNEMGSYWVLTLLYLNNVLYWPKDECLRSKHVAIMWPECIHNIAVLIHSCVLTECNTLYKIFMARLFKLLKFHSFCRTWMNACGVFVEWYRRIKTGVVGEQPVSVPSCPPQIPRRLTLVWTQTSKVGGLWRTAWAIWRFFRSVIKAVR